MRYLVQLVLGVVLGLVPMSMHASEAGGDKGVEKFPDNIFLKTGTETFDLFSEYLVRDGKIWHKPLQSPDPWTLFEGDGLPHPNTLRNRRTFVPPAQVKTVLADADHLVAISDEGRVYSKTRRSKTWGSDNHWHDKWGVPRREFNLSDAVNRLTQGYRAISLGRRNQWVKYSEDPAGNPHHFGVTGTSTLYVLDSTGQEIYFVDSGLPQDMSHRICGPDRGTYIAENLSTSASTLFVINRFGETYTKMEDYDLNGGSSPVLDYSYDSVPRPQDSGQKMRTNWHTWALPLEDWRKQPPVVLKGRARLSKEITITQNGEGNAARELRIGGLNEQGDAGYYTKQIFDPSWNFVKADIALREDRFLDSELVMHPELAERGFSKDIAYRGTLVTGPVGTDSRLDAELLDFNLACSPARLRIYLPSGHKYFDVLLHTTEMWALFYKRVAPGLDGTPKLLFGTLEIPTEVLNSEDLDIQIALSPLRPLHKRTFEFVVQATKDEVYMESKKVGSLARGVHMNLFRTSIDPYPLLSKNRSDSRVFSFYSEEDYLNLANSTSLRVQAAQENTKASLREKIILNQTMKEQLRKNMEAEEEILHQQPVMRNLLRVVAKTLPHLRGEKARWSPIKSFTRRGALMMNTYKKVGERLLLRAQHGYQQAMQVLDARIMEYSREVQDLLEK